MIVAASGVGERLGRDGAVDLPYVDGTNLSGVGVTWEMFLFLADCSLGEDHTLALAKEVLVPESSAPSFRG